MAQVTAGCGVDARLGWFLRVPLAGQGVTLSRITDGRIEQVDQSVHGNDFWQTEYNHDSGTYSVTFNVFSDTPGDERSRVSYVIETK